MGNKYIVCRICFGKDKNPPILATIDNNGVLHIKRYHKASTVIQGADIIITCDQCGGSMVLQIRVPQPKPINIIGTIMVQNEEFKYIFK